MKKLKQKKNCFRLLGLFLTLALLLSFFPLVSLGQDEASQGEASPKKEIEEIDEAKKEADGKAEGEKEELEPEALEEEPPEEEEPVLEEDPEEETEEIDEIKKEVDKEAEGKGEPEILEEEPPQEEEKEEELPKEEEKEEEPPQEEEKEEPIPEKEPDEEVEEDEKKVKEEPKVLEEEPPHEEVKVEKQEKKEEQELRLSYKGLILLGMFKSGEEDFGLEVWNPSLEECKKYMRTLRDWHYASMSFFALKGDKTLGFTKETQERLDVYKLDQGALKPVLDGRLSAGKYFLARGSLGAGEEVLLKVGDILELTLEEGCWLLEGDQILEPSETGFRAEGVGQARLVYFSLDGEFLNFRAIRLVVESLEEAIEEDKEPEEDSPQGEDPKILEAPEEEEPSPEAEAPEEEEPSPKVEAPEEAVPEAEAVDEVSPEVETLEDTSPEEEAPENNQDGVEEGLDGLSEGEEILEEGLLEVDDKKGEKLLLMASSPGQGSYFDLRLRIKNFIGGNYGDLSVRFTYRLKINDERWQNFNLGHREFRDFIVPRGARVSLEIINPNPYKTRVQVNGKDLEAIKGVYILDMVCQDREIVITNTHYVNVDMGLSQEEGLLILSLGLIFLVVAFLGWRRWSY